MYLFTNELAERGKNKMEKKNIMFTKDGMKVGVKTVAHDDYADKTQRCVCYQPRTSRRRRRRRPSVPILLILCCAQCPCQGVEFGLVPRLQEQAVEYRRDPGFQAHELGLRDHNWRQTVWLETVLVAFNEIKAFWFTWRFMVVVDNWA
jgi:hypothetical protein